MDWGTGVLQTRLEYDNFNALDEAFALRELRAKVNGKAGVKTKYFPNRFSINAEFCYGKKSVEIVRKYLDSGVLEEWYESRKDACWDGAQASRFLVLGACAISLGSELPGDMKDQLVKMTRPEYVDHLKQKYPAFVPKPKARVQLKKALAEYEVGKPYNYGNKTFLENSPVSMFSGPGVCSMVGPPSDEELGQEKIYPNHLCATCGAEEKSNGGNLLCCARCKDRKYCSTACQKKHWKYHKPMCMRDLEKMQQFMDSLSLDDPSEVAKLIQGTYVF